MSVVGGLSNSLQPFRCATCGCGQPLDCARDARILEDKTSCEVADPVGRDRVLSNTSPGGATQFILVAEPLADLARGIQVKATFGVGKDHCDLRELTEVNFQCRLEAMVQQGRNRPIQAYQANLPS